MEPDVNNQQIPAEPQPNSLQPNNQAVSNAKKNKFLYFGLAIVVLVITFGGIYWLFHGNSAHKANLVTNVQSKSVQAQKVSTPIIQRVQLVTTKAYGDKYQEGILPVGDNKYVSDSPKQGYVYACSGYAQNLKQSPGGASQRGPWFVGTTQYDLSKKSHVSGAVTWQAQFSNNVSGGIRTITTNDLPDHTTGVFPISPGDPAYAYDRNPNSIKGQTFTYSLNSAPSYGSPSCMGGQIGIMLSGVALFSGFDAAGRDAGAWEVQDSCSGHPEKQGIYHYHTLSSCIKDTNVKTVIGFALDGFPITGPKVGENNILTSSDLDECHGLTSQIVLDGKTASTYHYVMTQDFPYSLSCFRGKASQPPGQQGISAPKS